MRCIFRRKLFMFSLMIGCISTHAEAAILPSKACASVVSSQWRAWVNAAPSNGPAQLILIGALTLSSGGYKLELTPVAVTRQGKRSVVTVELEVIPPKQSATSALDEREVRLELSAERPFPMTSKQNTFAAIRVVCGNKLFATIKEIDIAW